MPHRRMAASLVAAILAVLSGTGLWLQFVYDETPGAHRITVLVPPDNDGKVAFQLDRYRGGAAPVTEFVVTGMWTQPSPVTLELASGAGRAGYHGVVDSEVSVKFFTGPDGGEARLVVDGIEGTQLSLRSAGEGVRVERLRFDESVPVPSWFLLALMIGVGALLTTAAVWCVRRLSVQRGIRTATALVGAAALLVLFTASAAFSAPAVVRAAGAVASVLNHLGIGVTVGLLVVLAVALALGVRPPAARAWITAPGTGRDRWGLTILLALVPFLGWLALHLVFWPGLMNPDVMVQWFQLDRTGLDNWHPYSLAVVLGLLRRIVESPALPILLQTAGAALLAGRVAAWTVWRGRSPWVAAATLVLLPVLPPTGLFTVTLWKDALFGIALLGLALVVWRIEDTNGRWLSEPRNIVFSAATLVGLGLTRHNAWPIIVGTAILLLVAHREFRQRIVIMVGVASATVLIVGAPLADALGVDENRIPSIVYVQHIAMHVNNGTELTSSDRKLLQAVYPLDGRWPYNCSSIQPTWSGPQAIPLSRFVDKASRLRSVAIRLALRDPGAEFRHFLCSSELVWKPGAQKGVTYFHEWSDTAGLVDYIPRSAVMYDDMPTEDPGSPRATARIYDIVMRDLPIWVIRPAVYLYAFLLAIAFAARRSRSPGILRIAAPATLQSLALAALTLTQDVRFQYGVILTAVVFVPALLTVRRSLSPEDEPPLRWSTRP